MDSLTYANIIIQKLIQKMFLRLTVSSIFIVIFLAGALTLFAREEARAADPVCSRSDIIFCEGFERPLRADGSYSGWDWNTNWDPLLQGTILCLGGSTNPTRPDITLASPDGTPGTTPYDDNCSLYWHAMQDASDGIFPEHHIPDQPAMGPVYARFYIKYSSNFQWNAPGAKVFYIRSNALGTFSWAYELGSKPASSSNLTGPGVFYIDIQTHAFFLPYNAGPCASNSQCTQGLIYPGQWYAVEMLCIPNSQAGVSDGTAKLWINGVLVSDYSPGSGQGVDFRTRAGVPTSPINDIWISAYVGGPTNPHPPESIWYDDIVASTSYIGPKQGAGVPAAPTNLTVP